MKKLFLFLSGIFLLNYGIAQTHVSGLISGQTWTPAGNPYIVDSNILVATLTIEPGVQIYLLDNVEFRVGGVLTAIGTQCDSI